MSRNNGQRKVEAIVNGESTDVAIASYSFIYSYICHISLCCNIAINTV